MWALAEKDPDLVQTQKEPGPAQQHKKVLRSIVSFSFFSFLNRNRSIYNCEHNINTKYRNTVVCAEQNLGHLLFFLFFLCLLHDETCAAAYVVTSVQNAF